MLKVGITGGIGSGKSIVSRVFNLLGIPVYDSDKQAKALMQTDNHLRAQLTLAFGNETYTAEGNLNTTYLAAAVFNNPEALQKLNALVHPAVGQDFEKWVEQQTHVPYVLKEAALIFEAGIDKRLNKVISVLAPVEERLQRLQLRDPQRSTEQVLAIMQKQLPEEVHRTKASYLIINSSRQLVIPQVLAVHEQLLKLSE